ncbi:MAG TPA: addiction module protein [Longimicrobiaceae bacterium]
MTRADLFRLPLDERLQLLEDLWDSIARDAEGLPLTEAQRRELDRRWALYEADPGRGLSWDEAKAEILRDL